MTSLLCPVKHDKCGMRKERNYDYCTKATKGAHFNTRPIHVISIEMSQFMTQTLSYANHIIPQMRQTFHHFWVKWKGVDFETKTSYKLLVLHTPIYT
jgi:hypothetical protein